MSASELFKTGRLQESIDAQIKEVKSSPADQAKRVFLFELLAFAGDLDRARRQIEAVQYEDPEIETSVIAYRKLVDAEQARRQLFSAGVSPQFLADPPEHVRLRLEALTWLREGKPGQAQESLAKAATLAPDVHGQLNGKAFTSLRDCDDRLATVLEVMSQGAYHWVPLEQVGTLAMKAPQFPRDLLWVPAHLEMLDGPSGDVFVPALYPGSHEHADSQVKLGRSTDWKSSEGGPVLGHGLRMFLVDDDAVSLLEWRELEVQGVGVAKGNA